MIYQIYKMVRCIALTNIDTQCSRNAPRNDVGDPSEIFCHQHQKMVSTNPRLKTINDNFYIADHLDGYCDRSDPDIVFLNDVFHIRDLCIQMIYGIHINQPRKIILYSLFINGIPILKINTAVYKRISPVFQFIISRILNDSFQKIESYKKAISSLKELNLNSRSSDDSCGICWDKCSADKNVTTECCNRVFCNDCLLKTIRVKNRCPLCRKDNFIKL